MAFSSKLNFVDLAGSERLKQTDAHGLQLEECKKINLSLSCLSQVIYALSNNKKNSFIPYRNSKLTRILEDSLGGNCITTLIATISIDINFYGETLSTLKFAVQAQKVKTKPLLNKVNFNKKLYEGKSLTSSNN